MARRRSASYRHWIALGSLTILAAFIFFYGLGERSLHSGHEGRAGQHARLMLDTNQWGIPTLFWGSQDYQKPPLFYWLVAAVSWIAGQVDAWSIRAPAAFSAIIGVWLVYLLGCQLSGQFAGFAAATMMMTSIRYCWLGRVGRIDMPMTLMIAAVMYYFWRSYRSKSSSHHWMMMHLATAFAMALKGPIGIALPWTSIGLFLVAEKACSRTPYSVWSQLRRLRIGWGIIIVALLGGGWYVWVSLVTEGEFLKTFLLHHHVDRVLGIEGLKPEPVWYYVPRIMVDWLPWSLLLPITVWTAGQRFRSAGGGSWRFLSCWVLGMFGLLSAVQFKRHDYLLPIVPGIALITATSLRALKNPRGLRVRKSWRHAIAAVAVIAGGLAVVQLTGSVVPQDWLDRHLPDRFAATVTLVRQALQQTNSFWIAGGWTGVAAIAGVVAYRHALRARPRTVLGLAAIAWSGIVGWHTDFFVPAMEPVRSHEPLAELARSICPDDTIYCYGREDQQMLFCLGQQVERLADRMALRRVLSRSKPVFVMAELNRFKQRRQDWPEFPMYQLSTNTDNRPATHVSPMVLVTNEAGWESIGRRGPRDIARSTRSSRR